MGDFAGVYPIKRFQTSTDLHGFPALVAQRQSALTGKTCTPLFREPSCAKLLFPFCLGNDLFRVHRLHNVALLFTLVKIGIRIEAGNIGEITLLLRNSAESTRLTDGESFSESLEARNSSHTLDVPPGACGVSWQPWHVDQLPRDAVG